MTTIRGSITAPDHPDRLLADLPFIDLFPLSESGVAKLHPDHLRNSEFRDLAQQKTTILAASRTGQPGSARLSLSLGAANVVSLGLAEDWNFQNYPPTPKGSLNPQPTRSYTLMAVLGDSGPVQAIG